MNSAHKKISINLISPDAFSGSVIGKILLWALSVGRYIVVFTELIVILSFLSRFKLDRDLTDLNSEISKTKAVIESYGDLEAKVRKAQNQIEIVRQKQTQTSPVGYLNIISTVIPGDVRFQQLNLQNGSLQITAVALSSQGLSKFVRSLAAKPEITNLTLSSVTTIEDGSGITFELKGQMGASPSNNTEKTEKPTTNQTEAEL